MSSQERTWGMLCHLSALAGLVMPFGHLIGPLVVWLIKRHEYPFVEDQGREALNFQLSVTIYALVILLLTLGVIGFVLIPIFYVYVIVFTIIASVKANDGHAYRYPLTIRFFGSSRVL